MPALRMLLLIVAACCVTGCSQQIKGNALLEKAISDYQAALNNPQAVALAPLELQQAGKVLDQAYQAQGRRESTEEIEMLATLARNKIMLATEKARQLAVERDLSRALKERDKTRKNLQT